jgi:hypothetical protein
VNATHSPDATRADLVEQLRIVQSLQIGDP